MSYLHIRSQLELERIENVLFDMLDNDHLHFIMDNHHCTDEKQFNFVWEGKHPSIKIVKIRNDLISEVNSMCIVFYKETLGEIRLANTTCPICAECTYVVPL